MSGDDLVIGVVNNLPARALARTTEQFATLLQAAANGRRVRLRCFASCVDDDPDHEPIAALWDAELAGLIVSGVEPQATDVPDEPLWPLLARLTDWAADHTVSAIWSCMATQAAVYRLSGLRRQRLPSKLSGVYACMRVDDHPLSAGAPPTWSVPHSRYFDLEPDALRKAGYRVLSSGPGFPGREGINSFTIEVDRSLFVMLQGHPEYGADNLKLEYRRDVRRFLDGTGACWPPVPVGYFDCATADLLASMPSRAREQPVEAVLAAVDAALAVPITAHWRPAAVRLYDAWLSHLATGGASTTRPPAIRAAVHPLAL